ncbi:30S ribosomal protein S5 [Patescibacteria group bacterium]|nr:30S ribosomal protein S5 [Patescibacteria group bacterium]
MTDQPQPVTENPGVESTFAEAPRERAGRGRGDRGDRGRRGAPRRREEKPRSEFDQKIIQLRRVARVVAGGRRFSFSAAIVAGDRKGRVGIGIGKGGDTALAVDKAFRDAKRNMFRVRTTEQMSIPHDVMAKNSSGIVEIRPAPDRGIVAGSSVKTVLELAGIKDVTSKILSGSKNKLNIARAAVDALKKLKK